MAANLELIIHATDRASHVLLGVDDRANKLGDTLRRSVTAGALAGGTALIGLGTTAVVLAAKFEESLAKIAGLTATPASAIDGLREQILRLSTEVAISPEELGAGAYFILSSGISDVTTAMAVLEKAAKASAAGLGETRIIADALTSVMNAYQLSAADAGRVTDTLVNIVKLGKGEPVALAGALGRVIPIAAQMGIEFEQVGAVLSTLTNTGLDAEESVTALRGIMNQILSPTEAAAKKFAELGFPLEDLRRQIDEDFIGAMQRLFNATGGSEEALALLFPEIRGLIGTMAAFGNQADQTASNLAGIQNGAGSLDAALEKATATTNFKFRQAMISLNVILTKVGLQLLPIITRALAAFSQWLSENEEDINRVVRALGSFAQSEAFPFLASAFQQLTQLIRGIIDTGILQWLADHKLALIALAYALGVLALAFGGPVIWITVLITAGTLLLAHWDQIRAKVDQLVTDFEDKFPFLAKIVEFVFETIKARVEFYINSVRAIIQIVTALIHGDFGAAWEGIKNLFSGFLNLMLGDVTRVFGLMRDTAVAAIKAIPGLLLGLAGLFTHAMEELGLAMVRGLVQGLSKATGLVGDVASGLIRAIKDLINSQVIDRINNVLEFKINNPFGKDIHIDPPDIPHLAMGGIVTRPTMALIAERGPEAVIPLNGGGLSGRTVNLTVNLNTMYSNLTPADRRRFGIELASLIREHAFN